MTIETMLWRRLDAPGHDACRLWVTANGWELTGTAVCRHDAGPACLDYEIEGDAQWRTRSGRVRGWVGSREVRADVQCSEIRKLSPRM